METNCIGEEGKMFKEKIERKEKEIKKEKKETLKDWKKLVNVMEFKRKRCSELGENLKYCCKIW